MPSLHWILALILALLHYLAATPVPTPSVQKEMQQKSKELLRVIDDLMNSTCKNEDSTFYSASIVQAKCIETVLDCAMKELATVPKQCFDTNNTTRLCMKASNLIKTILSKRPKTQDPRQEQECSACETHKEKSFKEFLSDLKTLVQQLNIMS